MDLRTNLIADILRAARPENEKSLDEAAESLAALGCAYILACQTYGMPREVIKQGIDVLWKMVEAIDDTVTN